jgi:hypothetical protein
VILLANEECAGNKTAPGSVLADSDYQPPLQANNTKAHNEAISAPDALEYSAIRQEHQTCKKQKMAA